MLYEAEQDKATLAICGNIMPSRRLAVFREAKFLALCEILSSADACFANLENMVVRYGEQRDGRGISRVDCRIREVLCRISH